MTSVTVEPDGTVFIQIAEKHEVKPVLTESEVDLLQEQYFSSGWNSAVQETMLHFANGTLPKFYQECGGEKVDDEIDDNGRQILKGKTLEEQFKERAESQALFSMEDVMLDEVSGIRKVGTDTGEAPGETAPEDFGDKITMTMAELKSHEEASFKRGFEDGQTSPRHTDHRTIAVISSEIRDELVRLAAFEETDQGWTTLQENTEKWMAEFATRIAKRLGYIVDPEVDDLIEDEDEF